MSPLAFLAITFGLVFCAAAYSQEDGIRYVQAYCHTLSRQNPTLYAKYKLETKCFLAVEIFESKVNIFKVKTSYSTALLTAHVFVWKSRHQVTR